MQKIISGVILLVVLLGGARVLAVDPLPPEIEKGSLEKKAAYWEKTSRESGEQRKKVAQQRYDAALVYKRALLTHAEERLQQVEAKLESQTTASLAPAPSTADESSMGLYLLLAPIAGWLRER
jgi:hypothetical protein